MDVTYQLHELPHILPLLAKEGESSLTWLFKGEMGAGKTTLIHALAQYFGVIEPVSSPTYALVNEYEAANGKLIYHMDWYRLKDEDEAINAGIDELVQDALCWIEWPEKALGILPETAFVIEISVIDAQTRRLITEIITKPYLGI